MKNLLTHTFTFILAVSILLLASCEQENLSAETGVAPGGGTLTGFKAYTLEASTPDDVYGRIVFWKESTGNTLVEIGLYNTDDDTQYTTGIFTGKAADGSSTKVVPLYSINGASGEFSTHKFYVITDKAFYGSLSTMNAHVSVYKGADLVTAGDLGANADPVEEN